MNHMNWRRIGVMFVILHSAFAAMVLLADHIVPEIDNYASSLRVFGWLHAFVLLAVENQNVVNWLLLLSNIHALLILVGGGERKRIAILAMMHLAIVVSVLGFNIVLLAYASHVGTFSGANGEHYVVVGSMFIPFAIVWNIIMSLPVAVSVIALRRSSGVRGLSGEMGVTSHEAA
jgi:hypothetical protein